MKWLPAVITVSLTVLGAFTAPIQAFVAGHPAVTIVVGGVYALAKLALPSPLAK